MRIDFDEDTLRDLPPGVQAGIRHLAAQQSDERTRPAPGEEQRPVVWTKISNSRESQVLAEKSRSSLGYDGIELPDMQG